MSKIQDNVAETLPKCPTGIDGLDALLEGGLPKGRPTLLCGGAGCGKTLVGVEFLVQGARRFGEPGVLITFEENAEEITKNVNSLGFNLNELVAQKKMVLDHVYIERSEIEESGDFDLDGLFIRLAYAIDSIEAKRVVLDTLEVLFSGFSNEATLRAELRRLFRWLKDKGVTAIITAERGSNGTLTRQGLEEYVSDCVIVLEHRTVDSISTRHLQVIKYRGSAHGTNEYPFLIDESGISVLPITSSGLEYSVSNERISTGIPSLDDMLEGKGFYRGSSVLISGTAGTGKTSIASSFANSVCQNGERCLYLAFEESTGQIVRNMRSIGLDLSPWIEANLLKFHTTRATMYGLEMHLVVIHQLVKAFQPSVVIIDPVTNFLNNGSNLEVRSMVTRLLDFLKMQQITAFFTSLTFAGGFEEHTLTNISSLIDTWLLLKDIEVDGERNRGLFVLKSRGMASSNQIREFILSHTGIELKEAYLGQAGVLTGSARLAQEAKERAEAQLREQEAMRVQFNLERKRQMLENQIAIMRAEFEVEEAESLNLLKQSKAIEEQLEIERNKMKISRKV
ncbi:MAG: circadian clock protein KaiC [Chloroflexi bacterium]|uniref:non-specific serine/threonine protein kinase n=1 Tax=Candidatus Chlorohelix allophototropha TaxID=3003348 RepID=A0A8T7M8N8_9CHLR|nr:circadian clock protein KaiC [Chloroflexota bacterium]WJW68319.1 circadian clock protein KaiC [Chloroflexota bacterium L227-S17]